MRCDCHIHMVLDGQNWKQAIDSHRACPADGIIRRRLETYQALQMTYLRDGGDRWGVGKRARELAGDYGIRYRTPLAPLCKAGHYGSFIGKTYHNLGEYQALVEQLRQEGGDFVKIMISGLMDFNCYGRLTEPGLESGEIRELVHIAHEEGFAVMAHGNGNGAVEAAAEAGVDSVEHGAYLEEGALAAMAEAGTVWVPTLSTIGNLRGRGRFDEGAVEEILAAAMENVRRFSRMGGLLAPGTDAGAWAVPHGSLTEFALMEQALGPEGEGILEKGAKVIMEKF